jgi:radical SAM protein with 4Fe4S-binding SPASM domain
MGDSSSERPHSKMDQNRGLATARRLTQILWSYRIARRSTVNYPPYRLWIEPTAICNLKCPYCPNEDLAKRENLGFMDFGLFRKIIDEACQWVHDVNVHHRGESMFHPRFFDMVNYAGGRGVFTKLHTNGTMLDPQKAQAVLDSALGLISFSFDGLEKETYERYRVGGHFETTLENIVQFLRRKKERRQKRPLTVVEVMDFPDAGGAFSREKQREFARYFEGLPLDRVIIKKPHNWAGNVDVGGGSSTRGWVPCTFPWHSLVIMWDGKVGPCPHDFLADIILGDASVSRLSQIFNGERLILLREKMMAADVEGLKPCASCDMLARKTILGVPRESLGFLKW